MKRTNRFKEISRYERQEFMRSEVVLFAVNLVSIGMTSFADHQLSVTDVTLGDKAWMVIGIQLFLSIPLALIAYGQSAAQQNHISFNNITKGHKGVINAVDTLCRENNH